MRSGRGRSPSRLTLGLGTDRDHVAAAAHRHDRLADHAGQVGRAQHRVQPLPHSVLGGAQPPADGCQLGGGGVEDLAALVDAALDPLSQRRRRIQLVAQLGQVRPLPAGQPLRRTGQQPAAVSATSSSSGAVSRPPRRARPMGPATSRAPPMLAWDWSFSSRTASSVWSCSSQTWMASASGRAASASSRDGPKAVSSAEHADDGVELQRAQRARIGGALRPPAQRRERCGSSATEKRIGRAAHSPA